MRLALVALLALSAGCLSPAPSGAPMDAPVPQEPLQFHWSTLEPMGPAAIRLTITPSRDAPEDAGRTSEDSAVPCDFSYRIWQPRGGRFDHSPMMVIEDHIGSKIVDGGTGADPGHVHAGPLDTRPATDDLLDAATPIQATRYWGGAHVRATTEGLSITVIAAAVGAPTNGANHSFMVNLACDGQVQLQLEASRAVFYHNMAGMPGGVGAHAGLAGVQYEGGLDARFAAPDVRFYGIVSLLTKGAITLRLPTEEKTWSFEPMPLEPKHYMASGPTGDYKIRATWAGPLDYVVLGLVGFQPVKTLDEILSLPSL